MPGRVADAHDVHEREHHRHRRQPECHPAPGSHFPFPRIASLVVAHCRSGSHCPSLSHVFHLFSHVSRSFSLISVLLGSFSPRASASASASQPRGGPSSTTAPARLVRFSSLFRAHFDAIFGVFGLVLTLFSVFWAHYDPMFAVFRSLGVTFPENVGQGSTWDTELIGQIASLNAAAARAIGLDMEWYVMNLWADPRFGRLEEGFSEEPMLTAALVEATTLGSTGGLLEQDAYVPKDKVGCAIPAFLACRMGGGFDRLLDRVRVCFALRLCSRLPSSCSRVAHFLSQGVLEALLRLRGGERRDQRRAGADHRAHRARDLHQTLAPRPTSRRERRDAQPSDAAERAVSCERVAA